MKRRSENSAIVSPPFGRQATRATWSRVQFRLAMSAWILTAGAVVGRPAAAQDAAPKPPVADQAKPPAEAAPAAAPDAANPSEAKPNEATATGPAAPDAAAAEAQTPAQAAAAAGAPAADAQVELTPPGAAPAANAQGPAPEQTQAEATPVEATPTLLTRDQLAEAGYLPGYRRHVAAGMNPSAPRVGGMSGGVTPSFGAPTPGASDWSFKWSGYMTAALQASIDQRRYVADGQTKTVFHVTPMTIDDYYAFTGTSTVPGSWVDMNFHYGNSSVEATVDLATWNPSLPTTYYQLRSQYFINNAYVSYKPMRVGDFRLRFNIGYFDASYGGLGRYGTGMYQAQVIGITRGVGELTAAEYDLSDTVVATLEHGIMSARDGKVPEDIVAQPSNGWTRQFWPGAWIHHAHAGLVVKGEPKLQIQTHYLTNWSQDDRTRQAVDNPQTRQIDEANSRDGRISVYGVDARLIDDVWGYLAAASALIVGKDAYPLKGLLTYGFDGEQLTDRWWGMESRGNGKIWVSGLNYECSLAKIVSAPVKFTGEGPDVAIAAGLHVAKSWSDVEMFDRTRYKAGMDALYTFTRYTGIGLRLDRVAPTSLDSGETFHVIAPRLQFKTNWNTHETINLMYAKWFYGPRTRNDGTGLRTPERLDDQLVALNFNMWW